MLLEVASAFCGGCDLVLADGYTRSVHDKIVLGGRPDGGGADAMESVRLVFDSGHRANGGDVDALAAWVAGWHQRRMGLRRGLIAAVLTGGGSRRMGAQKSQMQLAGRDVLGRLCELLADRLGRVLLIGNRPSWRHIPACVSWHADFRPGLGPLGGIATALRLAAECDPPCGVCAVACDMPALGGELLDHLLGGRNRQAPATAPLHPNSGRAEPLLAVYEPHARRPIAQALDAGRLSVTDWLTEAGAYCLAVPDELADQLANANTPEQLQEIQARLAPGR